MSAYNLMGARASAFFCVTRLIDLATILSRVPSSTSGARRSQLCVATRITSWERAMPFPYGGARSTSSVRYGELDELLTPPAATAGVCCGYAPTTPRGPP